MRTKKEMVEAGPSPFPLPPGERVWLAQVWKWVAVAVAVAGVSLRAEPAVGVMKYYDWGKNFLNTATMADALRNSGLPVVDVVGKYGLATNDTGNATTTLDTAETDAPANAIMLMRPGTYRLTTAWTVSRSDLTWIGVGATLKYVPAAVTTTFIVIQADRVKLRGFTIDANASATVALWIDNGSSGSDETEICWNRIRGAYANAVNDPGATAIVGNIYVRRACNQTWIHHNIIEDVDYLDVGDRTAGGIVVSDLGWASSADNLTGTTIEGNIIQRTGVGKEGCSIRILTQEYNYDSGTRIINNELDSDSRRHLKVQGDGVLFEGNDCKSPSGTFRYSAISFNHGRNLVVKGNKFYGDYPDKIMEVGAGDLPASNFVLEGNVIYGAGTGDAFRIREGARNGTILGNRVSGVGTLAHVDGTAIDIDFLGNGVTNVTRDAVWVGSDGTNAPNRVSFVNTTMNGVATNGFRVDAGTNIHLGRYSAAGVAGVAESVNAAVTGTRALAADIQTWALNAGLLNGTNGLVVGGGTQITKILTATATLDFPNTAAQAKADLTITVTGAAAQDGVVLRLPAAVAAGSFTARVSGADTVTVTHHNYTAAAVDPASATYGVTVVKY